MNKIAENGEAVKRHVSVLLDASPLLLRSAGVKNYINYWARALLEQAGENSLSLFPFMPGLGEFAHEKSVLGPLATFSRLGLLFAARQSPYPFLNWITPACDIFHASNQVAHPLAKTRTTATIYDMTCWLMPELHSAANVHASRHIADTVFRQAAGLIAISECSRDDAVRVLRLDAQKIDVIYPG